MNVVKVQFGLRSYSSSAAICISCHTASSAAAHSSGLFTQSGRRVFRELGPRFVMVSCANALEARSRLRALLGLTPGW
jgi:hypothetical protein